jgi:hypothetical protein
MLDRAEGRLELRSLLAAVEVAPPVAAVDVFAAELGKRLSAQEVVSSSPIPAATRWSG